MKKILTFIIFSMAIIAISSVGSVSAQNKREYELFKEKQIEQSRKLEKFTEQWNSEKNELVFKESFGGAYFVDTELFVNVVKSYGDVFIKQYDFENEFTINYVDYSLSDLEEFEDMLMTEKSLLKIRQIGISEDKNVISIITELEENEFLDLISFDYDSGMLEIKTEKPVLDYQVKYTTNGEYFDIANGQCTVGFAAKDSSGNPGFVTAGHCVELTGATTGTNVYYLGDDHAGDVDSGWHFEDGDVDAAFIELRDPWIGTTWLPTKNLVFGYSYTSIGAPSAYYATGIYVTFFGTFNGDDTCNVAPESGYITYSGVTVIDENDNILYEDMILTNIETHDGDSGGPLTVWVYIGGASSIRNVIGVLSMYYDGNSYFSKASDIMYELNLQSY